MGKLEKFRDDVLDIIINIPQDKKRTSDKLLNSTDIKWEYYK